VRDATLDDGFFALTVSVLLSTVLFRRRTA